MTNVYDTYVVEIDYLDNFYYSSMIIRFIAPYAIRSFDNLSYLNIQYWVVNLSVGPCVILSELSSLILNVIVYITIGALGLSLIVYVVYKVMRMQRKAQDMGMGRTLNLFWGIIDITQLLNLLLYLRTEITEQVRRELHIFNYLNFNYNFRVIEQLFVIKNESPSLLMQKMQAEGNNISFMYNTFIQWCLLFISVLITLISILVLKQGVIISLIHTKQNLKNTIEFGLLLRVSSITICSMTLAICIQVQQIRFLSLADEMDFSFMILGVIWVVGYFSLSCYLINQFHSSALQMEKYTTLWDGLHTKAIFKRSMYLILDLRRVFFTISLVFLYDNQNTCISFLLVFQTMFLMILATKYPWKVSAVNIGITVTELLFTAVLLLYACTGYLDFLSPGYFSTKSRMIVGWISTSFIGMIVFIRMVFMIWEFMTLKALGHLSREGAENDYNPDEKNMIVYDEEIEMTSRSGFNIQ